jgi:transducin beta-like protein 2
MSAGVAPTYGSTGGGLLLWTCTDDTLAYLQDKNGKLLETINSNQMENYCGACSPCGRFFGIGSFQADVRLWEVRFAPNGQYATLGKVNSMSGHHSGVLSLAFAPDSKTAATSSKDGTLRVWRMELVSELDRPETLLVVDAKKSAGVPCFDRVSFSNHRGVLLATASSLMCFFNPDSGELLATLDYHSGPILDVAWSADGRFLATTTYNTVCVWDVRQLITTAKA